MKRIAMTLVILCALMGFGTQASAQCGSRMGGYGYSGGGYGGYGYGGGYGGGYGQSSSYFGNGGHDFQPHGHVTQTPYGASTWYGIGPHDFAHINTHAHRGHIKASATREPDQPPAFTISSLLTSRLGRPH